MSECYRLCRAEGIKLRHTILFWLHLILPAGGCLLFLSYYSFAPQDEIQQISAFLQAIGIAYPLAAGVACARSVELEEGNHFQTFLGTASRKTNALLAKWAVLQGMGLLAVLAAVFLFAGGYHWALGKSGLTAQHYLLSCLGLWLGSIPLYAEHLFLNLRFSKSVSMGVGVAQFLLAALFLTGLGDGLWQFFPCTWSARGTMEILSRSLQGGAGNGDDGQVAAGVCALLLGLLCVIMLTWFQFYEGRQCND